MSTDVTTWAYPADDVLNTGSTKRTKGKDYANPSSADRLVVRYTDGKYYPVETRYNVTDGSTASMIIVRREETRQINDNEYGSFTQTRTYDDPIVLYTTDSDGNKTFGGKGEIDEVGATRLQLLGIGRVGTKVTTEDTAKAIISTALGPNNTALSEEEFIASNDSRIKDLYDSSKGRHTAGKLPAGVDVTGVDPSRVTPPAAPVIQEEKPETTTDGTQPENNKPTGEQKEQESQFAIIKETFDYFTIDDKDIAALEAKLANGGGDAIQGGRYPLDANYGNYYGQDYCCIDQFRYQAPRKEQIFSKDPISNYSQGNLRISPLKEFIAKVDLPMPNTLADSNNVSWGADVMNNLSAAITSGALKNPGLVAALTLGANAAGSIAGIQGMGTLGAFAGVLANASTEKKLIEKLRDIPNVLKNAGTGDSQLLIQSAVGSRILAAAGVEVSPETLLARGLGVVPNSNMELLFNAPTLREFSFNWRLSPRDAREAAEVKKIIRFFKQGMAARTISSQAGDRSLFLGTPNIFRIQFKTANGQIIEGVNRIKPCAVTGTSVNYTPEGAWAAYDQGQPVSTVLSIRMQELEPVYASDYSEDVIDNRSTTEQFVGPLADPNQAVADVPVGEKDLYSIRPSEVGY